MSVTILFNYYSCTVKFEIKKCNISNFLLLSVALAVWGLLEFHTNFRIIFYFCKKYDWNVYRITLNLEKALGSVNMLLILIFLICEHEISFCSVVSFSLSFINILQFSPPCLNLFQKLFLMNFWIRLISFFFLCFSEVVLVCRNTTNFSVDLISCNFADFFFFF